MAREFVLFDYVIFRINLFIQSFKRQKNKIEWIYLAFSNQMMFLINIEIVALLSTIKKRSLATNSLILILIFHIKLFYPSLVLARKYCRSDNIWSWYWQRRENFIRWILPRKFNFSCSNNPYIESPLLLTFFLISTIRFWPKKFYWQKHLFTL